MKIILKHHKPFILLEKGILNNKVKEIIIKSLEIIKHKCDAKKLRFDLDDMLYDMFPDE